MAKQKQFKPLKGKCPSCAGVIEALKPPRYDVWDSVCECPNCKHVLFKIATHWKVSFHIVPKLAERVS